MKTRTKKQNLKNDQVDLNFTLISEHLIFTKYCTSIIYVYIRSYTFNVSLFSERTSKASAGNLPTMACQYLI